MVDLKHWHRKRTRYIDIRGNEYQGRVIWDTCLVNGDPEKTRDRFYFEINSKEAIEIYCSEVRMFNDFRGEKAGNYLKQIRKTKKNG